MKNKVSDALPLLFAAVLGFSAFLLFSMQPMVGKMLLPLVGGSPQGWAVALAFFQTALLAGYGLTHILSRLSPRAHVLVYLALLGLSILLLPVSLRDMLPYAPTPNSALNVFALLCLSIGLPFVAISMTSPTLQRLFSHSGHPDASDPYFLYAASNAGSFIGLLAYPAVIELAMPLSVQSMWWMYGVVILMGLILVTLVRTGKSLTPTPAQTDATDTPQEPLKKVDSLIVARWLFLAGVPSGLLVAITNLLTTDIISMPLLWVIPMSIYLLTLVAAFGRWPKPSIRTLFTIVPMASAIGVFMTTYADKLDPSPELILAVQLFVFGFISYACHCGLAALRPPKQFLTVYYLYQSVGGAAGGVFCAFAAPFLFSLPAEYPLLLIIAITLSPMISDKIEGRYSSAVLTGVFVMIAYTIVYNAFPEQPGYAAVLLLAAALAFGMHPKVAIIFSMIVFIVWMMNSGDYIYTERNFFGVVKVSNQQVTLKNGKIAPMRQVVHGTTLHGSQIMSAEYERTPLTYYSAGSPVSDVFMLFNPRDINVIGLGSGSLACYDDGSRNFTFIEIDPAMERVARTYFTYLELCPVSPAQVIIGDGRIVLDGSHDTYDLIVVDAFSSDTIPAHLLTREAMALYKSRLNPGGSILVHISNRYFRLDAPVALTAQAEGLDAYIRLDNRANMVDGGMVSAWVALFPPDADKTALLARHNWIQLDGRRAKAPWTDDFARIMSAFDPKNAF